LVEGAFAVRVGDGADLAAPALAEQAHVEGVVTDGVEERGDCRLGCRVIARAAALASGPDRSSWSGPRPQPNGSKMAFDDVIEKIGMTIDAAGVVVIVIGAAIAFVASAA
jgi:hypothetical protein